MGRNSDFDLPPHSLGSLVRSGDTGSIEQLIDDGLHRYRAGDLNGALVAWERVLALEPANVQASSYVGYVRENSRQLHGAAAPGLEIENGSAFSMFGMDEHPEYVIESSAVRAAPIIDEPVRAAPALDSFRDDWLLEEDVAADALQRSRTRSLELSLQLALDDDDGLSSPPDALSFDSLTTEYTGVKTQSPESVARSDSASREQTPQARASRPPQLEVRVRSPSTPLVRADVGDAGGSSPELLTPQIELSDPLSLGSERATIDMPAVRDARTTAGEDLIASLPTPRRVASGGGSHPAPSRAAPQARGATPGSQAETWRPPDVVSEGKKRDSLVGPPRPTLVAAPSSVRTIDDLILDLSDSAIGDLAAESVTVPVVVPAVESPAVLAGDLGVDLKVPPAVPPVATDDRVGAGPTQELPRLSPTSDDDELPTRQSARADTADAMSRVRTLRRSSGAPSVPFQPRHDPINARAAQILDEVDADGGRIDEPRDERIRRRVTTLLARASDWIHTDPEKAVCAAELAMCEDPNSALAQKLIHRNRETIMNVFQNFLGNLDHKPQLDRPLHELSSAAMTPRAAFLLSRVDGQLTLDEILDVSGMPRLEAYRHLCQLFLHKVLS